MNNPAPATHIPSSHPHYCNSRRKQQLPATLVAAQRDTYLGGDGRPKSTFEDAFHLGRQNNASIPWQLSWQRNERHLTFANETTAHIVKGFAAREMRISDKEMDAHITLLACILPELPFRLHLMKAGDIAGLAKDPQQLAQKLVHLNSLLPTADVAALAVRQPTLMLQRSDEELTRAVQELQSVLSIDDICWLVLQYPQTLLNPCSFCETITEVKRMQPKLDIASALHRNPAYIFAFERRSNMIPYDS